MAFSEPSKQASSLADQSEISKVPVLVVLGDSNTGKSSLLRRFVSDCFIVLESSYGASYISHARFELWDTAGQERYRSLAPMYYQGASAAVVVYDITDKESFDGAKSWVQELQVRGESLCVIALVGNKLDLEDSRQVSVSEAQDYAESRGLIFKETSAVTGVNVKQLFEEIEGRIPTRPSTPVKSQSPGVVSDKLEDVYADIKQYITRSSPDSYTGYLEDRVNQLIAELEVQRNSYDELVQAKDKEIQDLLTQLIDQKIATAVKSSEMEVAQLRHIKASRTKEETILQLRAELAEFQRNVLQSSVRHRTAITRRRETYN